MATYKLRNFIFFFVIAQNNANHKHAPFNQFLLSRSTGSVKSITWSKHLPQYNKPLHLDKTFSKIFKSTDNTVLLTLNGNHLVVLILPECHLEAS